MFTESSHTREGNPVDSTVCARNNVPCAGNNITGCPTILTGLSHEVRTYMNSIVAFSFLINNNNCSETEKNDYNKHILDSCEQLVTLFDNFLDSAIINAKNPPIILSNYNLKDLLEELAIELNSSIKRFDKEDVSLVIDDQGSSFSVSLEEEKIIRVIKNLFYNALQNTTSGYIKLGYKFRDNKVIFYVVDSGIGYEANKDLLSSANLTDHLIKHNNTFTTIGLILSNQLITNMGGELWVEPNGVNGTGIYFSVPARNKIEQKDETKRSLNSRISV